MTEIIETNEKILPLLLVLNSLFLIVGLFYFNRSIFLLNCLLNIILLGTNLIIKKYAVFFQAYSKINGFANVLNNKLSTINLK
jgi:hypothetical protein